MQALRKQYNNNSRKSMVYTKSLSFAKDVYATSEHFPDLVIREKLRESAISIGTNIAQSRVTMYHAKEFNYLNGALLCISQCRTLLQLALVRGFLMYEEFQEAECKAVELLKMSFTLIKRLEQYVTNIEVEKWMVEDFRQSHLYNRSIDLMQTIYWLVDSVDFEINYEIAEEAYRLAINNPLFIATGIGQLNVKVRIKKFNEAKDNLGKLSRYLRQFNKTACNNRAELKAIEECRIQVVKLLNSYFGRLKSSNTIEQVK
ncbi:four helix bundle protein [Neobacillus citreus]|uniref:Four helix bundle protein n=1 Tax=Neobacillus citreus TaxID=2833578 RepID=A0A942YDU1_9BACI|nr:four helix bundle protein [Neobacillus citreus]MCH6265096.1 four helix bundle protein [Neobacillus citreus]